MKAEIGGLAVLSAFLVAMTVSGSTIWASSQTTGSNCSLSFSGQLATIGLAPAGAWQLTSSECEVTGDSQGVTSGTFTGAFSSGGQTSTVTGTWNSDGASAGFTASSTQLTVSVTAPTGAVQSIGLGSNLQGVLTGAGTSELMLVGSSGQVSFP